MIDYSVGNLDSTDAFATHHQVTQALHQSTKYVALKRQPATQNARSTHVFARSGLAASFEHLFGVGKNCEYLERPRFFEQQPRAMKDEEDAFIDDENDPVVKEIPIYLSKRLENQLYVFQYPLRPKNLKTPMTIRKSFFKPENKEVKLEVNVNVDSANFDTIRAEHIAAQVDGYGDRHHHSKSAQAANDVVFENEILDKVIFKSTKVVQDTDKYAIGMFTGTEYHITPLKGFLQLRPCMDHLDKCAKRKRDVGGGRDEEEEEAGPSEAQAVTVKFARTYDKVRRELTYKQLKERSDAEKWVECTWHKNQGALSDLYKSKLLSESTDDLGQAKNVTPAEYLKVLVPDDQEAALVNPPPTQQLQQQQQQQQPTPAESVKSIKTEKTVITSI